MFKKLGAEAILVSIVVPLIFWFAGFIISTYELKAEVSDLRSDVSEIKSDVKEVKTILMTGKINEISNSK
jgi:cell division protein FtsL